MKFGRMCVASTLASVLVAVLTACGGGGSEDEEPEPVTPPASCTSRPELCK